MFRGAAAARYSVKCIERQSLWQKKKKTGRGGEPLHSYTETEVCRNDRSATQTEDDEPQVVGPPSQPLNYILGRRILSDRRAITARQKNWKNKNKKKKKKEEESERN